MRKFFLWAKLGWLRREFNQSHDRTRVEKEPLTWKDLLTLALTLHVVQLRWPYVIFATVSSKTNHVIWVIVRTDRGILASFPNQGVDLIREWINRWGEFRRVLRLECALSIRNAREQLICPSIFLSSDYPVDFANQSRTQPRKTCPLNAFIVRRANWGLSS
jgi:hypothetical protein